MRRGPIAAAPCRRAEAHIQLVNAPVFERHDLEDEIAALAHAKVHLPSGAWITIETTEALTAIDVNSGRFTQSGGPGRNQPGGQSGSGGRNRPPDPPARHWRPDRGGLYPSQRRHAAPVLAALEKSLGFDRAPVQISPMSEFGIVAITRKRVREPLARLTSAACPACHGSGRAPTAAKRGAGISCARSSAKPAPRRAAKSWPRPRPLSPPG